MRLCKVNKSDYIFKGHMEEMLAKKAGLHNSIISEGDNAKLDLHLKTLLAQTSCEIPFQRQSK